MNPQGIAEMSIPRSDASKFDESSFLLASRHEDELDAVMTRLIESLSQKDRRRSYGFGIVSIAVALSACTEGDSSGGGSDNSHEGESLLDGNTPAPTAIIQPLSLDLYNPSDRDFIPYNNVVATEVVEVSPNQFLHFFNVLLDVESSSGNEIPNKSNLVILELDEAGISIFDHQTINGNALMHFGDLNRDGVISLVMTLAGEDGRILFEPQQAQMQNLIYDVSTKTITYFGEPSWSHGGAIVDLTGDGFPEIIDSYFYGLGSTIYDGRTLEVKKNGSVFEAGPGMNAFAFGDINNDGNLNFYQRVEDRYDENSDNLIVGTVYQVNPDFNFPILQEFVLGSFSGPSVPFVSWNGDPQNPDVRVMGDFLGVEFGEYQSWYSALADLNGNGYLDILEILSFSSFFDSGEGYFVEGENQWKILIVFNADGSFLAENAKLIDLPFSGAHHGSMLFDFNLNGHLDLYFNISDNNNGEGFKINDRIYLNDGSGNFSKLSDDIVFDFDPYFTRNGSYSPVRIGEETYLSGLSSDVFGNDLSALLIPISDML